MQETSELREHFDLLPGERLDDLQRNHLQIIQNPERFCFGMDAVLLSGFAQVRSGDEVLDLGTGTGIIPILLEAKTKGRHFTGLEIQEESAAMARRSILLNHQQDKINIVTGDIKEASVLFGTSSFSVVTSNPPYMIAEHGLKNPSYTRAVARHEVLCTLDDVVRETSRLLKPNGHFYMVHRPFRLAEIICTLSMHRLELKRLRMVYPYVDKEPNMVLLEAVKYAKPRVTVDPPLIIWKSPNEYTDEMKNDYGY